MLKLPKLPKFFQRSITFDMDLGSEFFQISKKEVNFPILNQNFENIH